MVKSILNENPMIEEQEENKEGVMTKKYSRIIIALLVLICFLLICNVVSTGYLAYKLQLSPIDGNTSTSKALPDELSSEYGRTQVFESFVSKFNEKDNEGIITLLDPLVLEEISREKMDQQLNIQYQIAGNIYGGTYSHYEYSGKNRGRDWFVLYYRIQTDSGIGTLTFTVAQENQGPVEIWGFNIFIGS